MATEEMLPEIVVTPEPEQLSLAPPETAAPEQLSLAGDGIAPIQPPSATLARERTFKTNFGLSHILNKSPDEIFNSYVQGKEEDLRKEAAAALDFQTEQRKQKAIMDLASKKQGPLTADEMRGILNPFSPLNKQADPKSVVEQGYARKYVSTVQDAANLMKGTPLDYANVEIPEQVVKVENKASDLLTRMEFARTTLKNAEEEEQRQGWVPWIADQAKSIWQPYTEAKMRGLNENVGVLSGGLLLGTNLQAQADDLLKNTDLDTFKERFTKIVTTLQKDNPSLAKQFAKYVVGASTSDRILDSTFSLLAPADIAGVAKGSLNLIRKGSLFNYTNKAFKDAVKSAAIDSPTPATIAEGAGNLSEAAVQATVANAAKGQKLSPMDTLMSGQRLDRTLLSTNPGSLSREQVTRLENQSVAAELGLRELLETDTKVRRAINPLDNPENVRKLNAETKTYFKGIDNAIIDISDPIWDPITGTYRHEVTIGDFGANLHATREGAEQFAKDHGFVDVKIVEDTGPTVIERERLAGSKTDLRRKEQIERQQSLVEEALAKARKRSVDKTLTPAERTAARKDITFFRDALKKYKEDLEKIGTRTTILPARIEQQGLGYKFVVEKNLNESSDIFRKMMLGTPDSLSSASTGGIKGHLNAALGWVSGADNTLSRNESMQRKTAAYGVNMFKRWAKEQGDYIKQISSGMVVRDPTTGEKISQFISRPKALFGLGAPLKNKEIAEQFNATLNFNKTVSRDADGNIGAFFKTPGDLEDHYQRFYQRQPTMAEHEAYRAYVRIYEAERAMYEIAEYRNRARLGADQHQVFFLDKDKKRLGSGFFDGILEKSFPGGTDQMLILGSKKGEEKLVTLGRLNPKNVEKYKELVENGQAKVLRIYNVDSLPLRDFSDVAGNNRVRYVMSFDTETKPLEFNHVNRRGGGHFDYDYGLFVKQAGFSGKEYTGDVTLFPIDNRILGKDMINRMQAIMVHMRNNDYAAAKDLADKTLPVGLKWDEFSGWFKPGRDPQGKPIPPRLDLTQDLYLVERGSRTVDKYKGIMQHDFVDATKSGSDSNLFQIAYNQKRDSENLYTIEATGNKNNPIYNYVPAKFVDPIPTMNRSLDRAINSTFMDDYKFYAVEHWLREAEPFMRDKPEEIRSAPFWYFNNATKSTFMANAPTEVVSNLMSNRMKIKSFVGIPDKFDTWLHSMTQTMADQAYSKYGPADGRTFSEKARVYPIELLDRVKDPISYLRSLAFHAKLGLYAVPQFIVQAQTHATIWALEPRHGTVGTFAMTLHQYARFTKDEKILAHLDDLATKMNMFGSKMKPGEFLEARRELNKTGFEHVAGEYAVRDDVAKPNFVGNQWGDFLSGGQMFFREGERASRLTAWYTAFREYRDLHPTGPITLKDRQAILEKADLLTNNMSRASNSNLHNGVFSLTTQFLSYQIRMGELFLGNRISTAAKARMMGSYGLLYGVPTAIGVTGLPLSESIRAEAIDRGYVVGESWYKTMAMEGIPSWMTAMLTGRGDLEKGTFLNYGNRYGAQGMTLIRDILRSDKPFWTIIGGAGTNTFANTWASSDNLVRAFLSYFRSDEQEVFPVTMSDFTDLFKEISSVNQAFKVWAAINTGKWMSKNQGYIADVSKAQAIFMGITGTSPQAQDDMYVKGNIRKSEKAYQDYIEKEFKKEHVAGVEATLAGNYEVAEKHHIRARVLLEIGGFPTDKRAEVLSKAMKSIGSLPDTVDYSFALKNVPLSKWFQSNVPETRLEQYRTQLKIQEKKDQ